MAEIGKTGRRSVFARLTESGIGTDDDRRRGAWLDASIAEVEECRTRGST